MTWTVASCGRSVGRQRLVRVRAMSEGIEPIRIPKITSKPKRKKSASRRSVAFLENKNRYWLYQAPSNYTAPQSGDLMITYGAFPAYGPGSGGVGDDSSGKGRGGGGGGNWFGFGGSADGFSMGPMTLVFAAFLSLGGLIAYLKKGSLKSLVTSLVTAGSLVASMLLRSRNPALASRMQIATTGILTLLMGLRYLNNPSSVPAGVVTAASLLMTLGYAKNP